MNPEVKNVGKKLIFALIGLIFGTFFMICYFRFNWFLTHWLLPFHNEVNDGLAVIISVFGLLAMFVVTLPIWVDWKDQC